MAVRLTSTGALRAVLLPSSCVTRQLLASAKKLIAQMVLKCADIGHLAADPKTHRRWAYQLEEEFFRQVHRGLAMTVS